MNRKDVTALLAVLRTVWTEMVVTEESITGWMWAMEAVPFPLVQDAAKRYMQTGKFAPKPADLLELVGVQSVAPDLIPEAAWSEVQKEARRVGFNRLPVFHNGQFEPVPPPEFSSPLIADAVGAIGWKRICLEDDSKGFVRRDFVDTLKALMRRAVRDVQTGEVELPAPEIEDAAAIVSLPDRSKGVAD